jgi:hypothetical protein
MARGAGVRAIGVGASARAAGANAALVARGIGAATDAVRTGAATGDDARWGGVTLAVGARAAGGTGCAMSIASARAIT